MTELQALRALFDRVPGVCLLLTDAKGIVTHFGPGAEAFFARSAADAVGRLHYGELHDPEEMKACAGSPEFKAEIARTGRHEAVWTLRPPGGAPFKARVTLIPLAALDNPPEGGQNARTGWAALYRRIG